MKQIHITLYRIVYITISLLFFNCKNDVPKNWKWETITTIGKPTARHEAGFIAHKNKLYLIGGRRINPTSVFEPNTNTWTEKSKTPIEIHHFQPVNIDNAIYIIGAMTGKWPNEKPLDKVIIYYPESDEYIFSHNIPKHRQRGAAGALVYKDKIYLIGGLRNGHMNGYVPWFDEYDPKTGQWRTLNDAPNSRDHFQAVINNNKLYAFAGRRTSKSTNEDMSLTISHGNIYNFSTHKWETVTNDLAIPIERAGNSAFKWNDNIIIGGGESITQKKAHKEVQAYNTTSGLWSNWPSLNQGRHGTGLAIVGNYVYSASGCGKPGGSPELTSIERLELPKGNSKTINTKDSTSVFSKWHTITLSFNGPETSETDSYNPFLNYRLSVEFKNKKSKKIIRGFYSTNGNASETSAKSGSVWQVRFTPNDIGEWSYSAKLHKGDSIALSTNLNKGTLTPITNSEGNFIVVKSDKEGIDFRAKGRLEASNGYFKFKNTNQYWLKTGTNSPENLLGYKDFDDTYRIKSEAREGEAVAPEEIHAFKPHLKDWKTGDPYWKKNKGKSLIGGLNYLSEKGMNSAYFLTLNILGDGKDVWPYITPNDFTRFDVSKLDQWEIVFQHMQSKGILLHMVIQETENETMLDNGDTGPLRQLYFLELIARFGHHLGLVWNLGEENGPAPWTPIGQNDRQRKEMTKFIKEMDPYNHPVLLHTHSHDPLRSDILNDILGFKDLDGLSLQQAEREQVGTIIKNWKAKAKKANNEWLITMDEIGMWHTAALPDSLDVNHNTLTHHALWGALLSGAAGVEWYFGAKYPHNDLNSEDWRQRDRLWEITNHARSFFEKHVPYWDMQPMNEIISLEGSYCYGKENTTYVAYLPKYKSGTINLGNAKEAFSIQWYNPFYGGDLKNGSIERINGGGIKAIGSPPKNKYSKNKDDWVIIIKKIPSK